MNYVWFDALTNYISFIGYDPAQREFAQQPAEFREKWPALHIIGKDILIPAHGIYWPIMLHALGFPDEQMPKFLVHGWWNISGAKMSKSLGNVIDPDELADKYSPEALRYYLTSDIVTGKDADFSEERLTTRFNSELANSLGNLLNRGLAMIWKFREGQLVRAAVPGEELNPGPETMVTALRLAGDCNERIDSEKPWVLAKDPEKQAQLDALLYRLADSLRLIAILISPVLPKAAHGIFDQLNWKMEQAGQEARFSLGDAVWGQLPDGHQVSKPTPLFPRIEIKPPA